MAEPGPIDAQVARGPTAPSLPQARPWQLRVIVFFLGTLLVGAGIGAMVTADLGVAPTDVLSTGVAERLTINVGLAAWGIGTLLTFLAWAGGRAPTVGTFLGSVFVGGGAAAMLDVLPDVEAVPVRAALLAVGLALVYAGIGAIVASAAGTGPLELLMLALSDRGLPLHRARWLLEGTLLIARHGAGRPARAGHGAVRRADRPRARLAAAPGRPLDGHCAHPGAGRLSGHALTPVAQGRGSRPTSCR